MVSCGISTSFPVLFPTERKVAHALLTRPPLEQSPKQLSPLDLHVLGTPPAFVLSQDQTLEIIFRKLISSILNTNVFCKVRFKLFLELTRYLPCAIVVIVLCTYYRFSHCVLFKHHSSKSCLSGLSLSSERAYLIYHTALLLSSTFFKFFLFFFIYFPILEVPKKLCSAFPLRRGTTRLYYHIFLPLSTPFLKFFYLFAKY